MEWLLEKDGQLLLWLKETFSHPILDEIMISVSALGNKGFIWIAIYFSAGAYISSLLLKPVFARFAPPEESSED